MNTQTLHQSHELPDVNAETYPFEVVQAELDKASFLNLFAVPDIGYVRSKQGALPDDWFNLQGGYTISFQSLLHQFHVKLGNPVRQEIGALIGSLSADLLIAPIETDWAPGTEPNPRIYDSWQSQSLVSRSLHLTLGSDSLRGYLIGRTYPLTIDGVPGTVLCATANLVGENRLRGMAGTLCLQGMLTTEFGYRGNVSCRLADPEGKIFTANPHSLGVQDRSLDLQSDRAIYIVLRGQKARPDIRTEYGASPGPGLVSLVTPAEMRTVSYPVEIQKDGTVRSGMAVGNVAAQLKATVGLDILAPPGTVEAPNNFDTTNVYSFSNNLNETIGSITARIEFGKSFELRFPNAPGQPGMRYGGFGRILSGTGVCEGVQGTLIVNSAIGVAPHALSMLNVLRIIDPNGDFGRRFLGVAPMPRKGSRISFGTIEAKPSRRKSSSQRSHEQHLPDINQETHPFEQVERWLDEAVILNLYAIPKSRSNTAIKDADGVVIGFVVDAVLHRFDEEWPRKERSLPITNQIGPPVATLSQRCLFIPDEYRALPGKEPPPTRLDRSRSQRFVILESEVTLSDGRHVFFAFGTGRTYPMPVADGQSELQISAISEVIDGQGQFRNEMGTCTFCGSLTDGINYKYQGNVLIRFIDSGHQSALIHEASSRMPSRNLEDFEPGTTYLIYRGRKPTRDSRTEYTFDASGEVEGLSLQQELHSIKSGRKFEEEIRSSVHEGQLIGQMTANVLFNILNPGAPGTSLSPIPFKSINRFSFGRENVSFGDFEVTGGEGRTFNFSFPQAPRQRGLRFAAFGPIVNGTGIFQGGGIMTDNSVVGVAPHATSTLYVVRLKKVTTNCSPQNNCASANVRLLRDDPYSGLAAKMVRHKQRYLEWRHNFRKSAEPLANSIAAAFNERIGIGEFSGLAIDAQELARSFAATVEGFDAERFERYGGAARAVHREYDLATNQEVGHSRRLYSVWEPRTMRDGERRLKRISGSFSEYTDPAALPPLSTKKVDLILNAFEPQTGVTSWIDLYQSGIGERASIAYSLPAKDEVLWMVKDVSRDGRPLNDNVFMASHEWKRRMNGRDHYLMVGIFFQIEFTSGKVGIHGDSFWRELFVEST